MKGLFLVLFWVSVSASAWGSTFYIPEYCGNSNGANPCASYLGARPAGQLFNDTISTEVMMDLSAEYFDAGGCTTTCAIDSISFRTSGAAIASAVDLGNVDVYVSPLPAAESNGHLSSTWATNLTGETQTLVYSGNLTVRPEPAGTPPASDLTITFSTPYSYSYSRSSDLLFEIIWVGSKTALGQNEDGSTDTHGLVNNGVNNIGTAWSVWGSAVGTSGTTSADMFVAQVTTSAVAAVPEPATASLLIIAGILALVSKRKFTQ